MSSPKPTPLVPRAADLLGADHRAGIGGLADVLYPCCDELDAAFARELERRGLDARQRKALGQVTLGAAARMLAAGEPLESFFEQVAYNGRRLAKLDVDPAALLASLDEYDRRARQRLKAAGRAELAMAGQLSFAAVLTLSNAFYEVRERETEVFFALYEAGLEAESDRHLLKRYLRILAGWCRADAAAAVLWDGEGGRVASAGAISAEARPDPALFRGPALVRASSRLAIGRGWKERYVSVWSVPLERAPVRGVLQLAFAKYYEWLPRELRLLEGALDRCLAAAEKLRLSQQLAASEAQIRELAIHMVEVEERERRRISRELHDETGQVLPYVRLKLELLERRAPANLKPELAESRELIGWTVAEVRRILAALSPAVLEQLGLAAAVRQLLSRFRQRCPIAVRAELGRLGPVPKSTATVVYRLVQECCNNVARHASASHLNLCLRTDGKKLRMSFEDDGVGFRLEEALGRRDSFGLAGMRERVALAGGTLWVTSRPGRGTSIAVELPLEDPRWHEGRATGTG